MSPMWMAATTVLLLAGGLVAALAWRIAYEVDHLTAEVVALRRTRIEVASLRDRWRSDQALPR